MQLSYHAYLFRDTKSGQCFRADVRSFLHGYLKWRNVKFKSGFTHGGESIFLLPLAGEVRLFVQAKDNEIIKKIKRSNISVSEIRSVLERDDSVGFASFVYFDADYLAIGSTVLAPRVTALGHYINDLLRKLGIDLEFELRPLTYTLPKKEAVKLAHVGMFTMKVESGNGLWNSIVGSLGLGDRDDFDIGSMTISIRPGTRGANNKDAMVSALQNVDEHGLEAFDVRARVDVADKMADVYIVGVGGIRDPIDTSDERKIPDFIVKAAKSNSVLGERLNDFRKDTNVASVRDPAGLGLAWPPSGLAGLAADQG